MAGGCIPNSSSCHDKARFLGSAFGASSNPPPASIRPDLQDIPTCACIHNQTPLSCCPRHPQCFCSSCCFLEFWKCKGTGYQGLPPSLQCPQPLPLVASLTLAGGTVFLPDLPLPQPVG